MNLKIYKNCQLNNGAYKHVITSTYDKYLEYLDANFTGVELDTDNYRINGGSLIITANDNIYSYAVQYEKVDNVYTFFKCFFLRDKVTQSNLNVYFTEVDLWGTNIVKASLDNAHIQRINRQVENGRFQNDVDLWDTPTPSKRVLTNLGNYYIIVAIRYNDKESLFSKNVSETRLVAYALNELVSDNNVYDSTMPFLNALDIARGFVGGIYAKSYVNGTSINEKDVEVLNAWILPAYAINSAGLWKDPSGNSNVLLLSAWSRDNTNSSFKAPYLLYPHQYRATSEGIVTNAKEKKYYGTLTEYIELPSGTNTTLNVQVRYSTGTSEVHVELAIEDRVVDITKSFEIELTANEGNVAGLKAIKKAINLISSGAGIVTSLAKENPIGAISSTGNIVNAIGGTAHKVGGGDALVNFYYYLASASNNKIYEPFVVWTIAPKSSGRTSNKLNNIGVACDYYIKDLKDIFTWSLYETNANVVDYGVTYVMAELEVNGEMPKGASDFITSELNRGIKVIKYA